MKTGKVLLFNPRSSDYKARIPNSVLQLAASIDGRYEWLIVDGNLENDPQKILFNHFRNEDFRFFGTTVMPGPQLKQAIQITRNVRKEFPGVINIWGGYFPSNHPETVLRSGYVDYVVVGPGDHAFPLLLDALIHDKSFEQIQNIAFVNGEKIVLTPKAPLLNYDSLPELPYAKLNKLYPISRYLGRSYLGEHTIAYHSSFGCPFKCSFCAVVPIYQARWNGKSAENIYKDIKYLKENFQGDAIEFHDNNFFVSEKRTVNFARLIRDEGMNWWGEARIDTMDQYSDESLAIIREAGCRMIFFGAESGDDQLLKFVDKGGKQNSDQILDFARRLGRFDIVPEYSFVLGWPAESEREALRQVKKEISYIRKVKEVNPKTEIIIYVYSPVPVKGTKLFEQAKKNGFVFPERLEEWLNPEWEQFDLRKNPLTPWLTPKVIRLIKDFEATLNGYFPTITDIKLRHWQRRLIQTVAAWRYWTGYYHLPYELITLQRFWLKYRQPEKEGF